MSHTLQGHGHRLRLCPVLEGVSRCCDLLSGASPPSVCTDVPGRVAWGDTAALLLRPVASKACRPGCVRAPFALAATALGSREHFQGRGRAKQNCVT